MTPASADGDLRLALLSDLHLDIRRRQLIRSGQTEAAADETMAALQRAVREAAADADIVLALGDIAAGSAGLAWAAGTFPEQPVVCVAGNHEFYRHDLRDLLETLGKVAAITPRLRFLENATAAFVIRGRRLRVLGTTLWTDYALYDGAPSRPSMEMAAERSYDHHRIAFAGHMFRPEDALALHREAVDWLDRELARGFDGTTIVATHHAPSGRSVEPRFGGDTLSPAFASDLEWLMERHRPPLWLHGHTHHNVDYQVGETRVVAHQWGYPQEGPPLGVKLIAI